MRRNMSVSMLLRGIALVAVMVISCSVNVNAFHQIHQGKLAGTIATGSSTLDSTTALFSSITQRDVGQLQDWAMQCGVQLETGFTLVPQEVDGNEDWFAATSSGGAEGSRVLFVPGGMVLSASRVAQEYGDYVDASLQVLQSQGLEDRIPQFFLFLRFLVEIEQGDDSPWSPWIASLPRKWNTAVAMDDFCLSCLPPFIKSLCEKERSNMQIFWQALQAFEYISPDTKANEELVKFAYNVVMTRSFPTSNSGDIQLIPVGDMFNHGDPPNVAIYEDDEGNCQVIMIEDVEPGTPLYISYGEPTNPSRLLATFGFLNEDAPATYCKLLIANPSQELIDVGYDPAKLLFDTQTGAIASEVWDVVLYSRLERQSGLENDRRAFYQACMTGDDATKSAIHGKHFPTTCKALQRHVDTLLAEIYDLSFKMNAYDSSKHPRLPLLRKHNDMVASTFHRVRENLVSMASG